MKTLFIGLTMLVVGLLVGIAFMKFERSRTRPVAPPAGLFVPPAVPDSVSPGTDDSDPFTQIRRMQEQIDRMMNQSIQRFRNDPRFNGFTDTPGYSLSLDLREFKDRFEIHAALPDAKDADIHVKLSDDRTLSVEVGQKTDEKTQQGSASTTTEEWGNYTQTIQLPSAVQANKLKVDHRDHELVIILPKA
ncbi:MAG: Hsp20/alpha crystallin family protein [Opitutaceae bacterium]|jgi:HSP20 family molecular chaperone IbpA